MDVETFKNQMQVFGERWGTQQQGNKWRINMNKNGLREEIIKLQSKSVPFYDIFLKPSLIGKNYLLFKYPLWRSEKFKEPKLIGMLQSSEIDFENFKYCYLTANSDSMLISENIVYYSARDALRLKHRYPFVTEEYRENQKKSFLEEYFSNTIWIGCYALDLSYLIGNSGSVFMNWNSNPFQKN